MRQNAKPPPFPFLPSLSGSFSFQPSAMFPPQFTHSALLVPLQKISGLHNFKTVKASPHQGAKSRLSRVRSASANASAVKRTGLSFAGAKTTGQSSTYWSRTNRKSDSNRRQSVTACFPSDRMLALTSPITYPLAKSAHPSCLRISKIRLDAPESRPQAAKITLASRNTLTGLG